jgi:hypothetical protein
MPVRAVGKLFFNVTFLAEPVVPTFVLGKVTLVGASTACNSPAPLSDTVCGLLAALSVNVRVPVRVPNAVGVNVTFTLHFLPARNIPVHVFVEIAKSPTIVMPLIVSVAVPVFTRVTDLAAPVVSMASLPKLSEVDESTTEVVTVNITGVVCVKLPEVPLTSTGTVPVVAVPLAVSVSVLVSVAGFELKAAVTPLGRFDAENETVPPNPFHGVMVIVLVACAPCSTSRLVGAADSV